MTQLSVNVNKIALLRNSRGRDFPSVVGFVEQLLGFGVTGITVHPRPDQRHITTADVYAISELLTQYPEVEFNMEGYPAEEFLSLVRAVRPTQCTLVPDEPGQLTSDHGWDVPAQEQLLLAVLTRLREEGIRSSLFMDPDPAAVSGLESLPVDRIELYTEEYAQSFGKQGETQVWERYRRSAEASNAMGIGVNAGHDLDLANLPRFLEIPKILEVSIGHALVVESIQQGIEPVIRQYQAITSQARGDIA